MKWKTFVVKRFKMAAVKKLELLSLICMFAIGFSCKQKSSAQKIEAPDESTSERDRSSILDENTSPQYPQYYFKR